MAVRELAQKPARQPIVFNEKGANSSPFVGKIIISFRKCLFLHGKGFSFMPEINGVETNLTVKDIENLTDEEILAMAVPRPNTPEATGFIISPLDFKTTEESAEYLSALLTRLGEAQKNQKAISNNMKIKKSKPLPHAKPNTPYGFNPRKFVVQGKPELSLFSFNVLFMSYGEKDGKSVPATALYYPDLPAIGVTENTNIIFASYYNQYCLKTDDKGQRHCRLDMYYHKKIKSFRYSAIKYVNNTQVCHANGSNWKEFFANLTAYGLFNDECCKYEAL